MGRKLILVSIYFKGIRRAAFTYTDEDGKVDFARILNLFPDFAAMPPGTRYCIG